MTLSLKSVGEFSFAYSIYIEKLSERGPQSLGDPPKKLESCHSMTGFGPLSLYACQVRDKNTRNQHNSLDIKYLI
jgi:hypothetical protein